MPRLPLAAPAARLVTGLVLASLVPLMSACGGGQSWTDTRLSQTDAEVDAEYIEGARRAMVRSPERSE